MKIYVASSWRNEYYPEVVERLREAGHDVYDFRNPPSGLGGFKWSDIRDDYANWTPEQCRESMNHPLAERQFQNDLEAMESCDACVLVLPCGRSAHTEAGWFAGKGKKVIAYIPTKQEPELMYKLFTAVCCTIDEVKQHLFDGENFYSQIEKYHAIFGFDTQDSGDVARREVPSEFDFEKHDCKTIHVGDACSAYYVVDKVKGKYDVYWMEFWRMGGPCRGVNCVPASLGFDDVRLPVCLDEWAGNYGGVMYVESSFLGKRNGKWGCFYLDHPHFMKTIEDCVHNTPEEAAARLLQVTGMNGRFRWKRFEVYIGERIDFYQYDRRFTPDNITSLKENEVFVFGSNINGKHVGGAAKFANKQFGAQWGVGEGMTGQCYAIPTMEGGVDYVKGKVDKFIKCAKEHSDKKFLVTPIGCGIAGFKVEEIAPLFADAISITNIILPESFVNVICGKRSDI